LTHELADLPEVQNLPVREKLQLVDDLWLSDGGTNKRAECVRRGKDTTDERWASFLKIQTQRLTLEQFQEKMESGFEDDQLRLLPAVLSDVAEAAQWYDERGYPASGDRFLDTFYFYVRHIEQYGKAYARVYDEFHESY